MRFQVSGFRFQVLGFRNEEWGKFQGLGYAIRHAGRRGRRPLPRAHGAGPYHAPHGMVRRPRRAAYMETPTGDAIRRAGRRGRRPLPRHHMVSARSTHPMVGRDVLGAPRTWGRHGDAIENAHSHTGRRGRRPLPRHHMVSARSTHPMVGRDVPGAPRTRGRHGDAIRRTGHRGRRPLPRAHGVGPYHARTHLHTGWGPVSASRAESGAGTSRASPSATGCRDPKVSRRRRKRSQTSRSQNEKSDIIAP